MNFKARFERKASAPEVTDADIVGVVTLNQAQFAWFSERLLDDYDFIADYAEETYDDGERNTVFSSSVRVRMTESLSAPKVPSMPDIPPTCRRHGKFSVTRFTALPSL